MEVLALDYDVTWQPAQAKMRQPGPGDADQQDDEAKTYQKARDAHGFMKSNTERLFLAVLLGMSLRGLFTVFTLPVT